MLGSIVCRLCGRLRPRQAVLRPSRSVFAWRNPYSGGVRAFHSKGALLATKGEREITKILNEKLSPSYIEVRDISGGCGSMYEIWIDSEQFSGKRLIQQHRMVNEALGEAVVKSLHGLTIKIGNPKAGG